DSLFQALQWHGGTETGRTTVSVAGVEGLAATMEWPIEGSWLRRKAPSWLWVFEVDGWFLKVRCTAWKGKVWWRVPGALERLVGSCGWRGTASRVNWRMVEALRHSRDMLDDLRLWPLAGTDALQPALNRASGLLQAG